MATLDVIAEEGLDAVRHRRVADLAGVSPGSTTYHFASRDDLIDEAFAYYLDQAAALLGDLAPPAAAVDHRLQILRAVVHLHRFQAHAVPRLCRL